MENIEELIKISRSLDKIGLIRFNDDNEAPITVDGTTTLKSTADKDIQTNNNHCADIWEDDEYSSISDMFFRINLDDDNLSTSNTSDTLTNNVDEATKLNNAADINSQTIENYPIINDERKIDHETFCLPYNFEIGQAKSDGDCFFDSFRQGLQQLGICVTNDELRVNCREFAITSPPEWFATAIQNSHQDVGVRRETIPDYIEVINQSVRWGDPDIEGRILCERYKVSLYLIEYHITFNGFVYLSQSINAKGCKCDAYIDFNKNNTIIIINKGNGHFEPVIKIKNEQYEPDIKENYNDDVEMSEICNKRHQVLEIFNKLESVIKEGNIKDLNTLLNLLYQTTDMLLLADIYNDLNNSIRETHLITLACKYNKSDILDFLLHKSNILYYLPSQGPIFDQAYFDAIIYLMQSHDIRMLETLYDYWSGYVHWVGNKSFAANDMITNLRRVRKLLLKASRESIKILEHYQQMLVDVHCLISFNAFQIELFSKLSEISKMKEQSLQSPDNYILIENEVKTIITILLCAFDIYEDYSNKNIRLTRHLQEDINNLEKLLQEDSKYMKYLSYCMYELYYRKLDYSMALIIINNLHLLKRRLKMQNQTYQEIEASLYNFLYRVNEDWKYYLPENRPKYRPLVLGQDKDGLIQFVKILHDPHRLLNGPVIYFEWQKFRKSLEIFKSRLKNTDIVNSIRQKGTKIPKEEINNLSLLPNLRDDYSLKKILEYLEQVSYMDINQNKYNNLLMIQRIIQIIGEFFKNTKDTWHLSPTTLALLQCEIPQSTYKNILYLRNIFSHARDGKLIKRIDLENTDAFIFPTVLQDLKEIKKGIHKVIDIYKPVLEKSLFGLGMSLIGERYDDIPQDAMFYKPIIESINEAFHLGHEIYAEMENTFINQNWKILGFTRQLFREIASLSINSIQLKTQRDIRYKNGIEILKKNMSKYTNSITYTITIITKQNNIWEAIKNDLVNIQATSKISVLNHPNESCIKNITAALKNVKKEDTLKTSVLSKISDVKECTTEWDQIKQLVDFIVLKLGLFEEHPWEIKHSAFTNECNQINRSYPDNTGVQRVQSLITEMISYTNNSANDNNQNNDESVYIYKGIQNLGSLMQTTFFVTAIEMDYLKNNSKDVCECVTAKICIHREILEKLYNNTVINEKEYECITSVNINDKCKKIIKNLTNGNKRDNNMLECLTNRTNHLHCILEGEREINSLILRYRHDVKFRITIEMIVSDIMNIYAEGWLVELVNTSYTKLLSEYPLRNILEHGNPLLEISSITLDANDFPRALMKFALDAVEDKSQLDDLFTLYEADVDRADVFADLSNNLNTVQIGLVNNFKKCKKWKSYVKLLP